VTDSEPAGLRSQCGRLNKSKASLLYVEKAAISQLKQQRSRAKRRELFSTTVYGQLLQLRLFVMTGVNTGGGCGFDRPVSCFIIKDSNVLEWPTDPYQRSGEAVNSINVI
jgi:hypothetical protein